MVHCYRCNEYLYAEECLKCTRCEKEFHFRCVGQGEKNFRNINKDKYKCPTCKSANPNLSPPSRQTDQSSTQEQSKPMNSTFNLDKKNEELGETKNYFEEKFLNLETMMNSFVSELKEEFKKRCDFLETKMKEKDDKITDLENKIDELEIRSRICNIEIRNVPETQSENVTAIVEKIGKIIGIEDIGEGDIQVAHRVFSRRDKGQRPIVALLSSRYMKNKWINKYKEYKKGKNFEPFLASEIHSTFKTNPIYIFEHITTKRKMLLKEVRDFAKTAEIKHVWTKEGVILVKKGDSTPIYRVTNMMEFEKLKTNFGKKGRPNNDEKDQ